jgi:ABC-2 type transport system ATP-binding protein
MQQMKEPRMTRLVDELMATRRKAERVRCSVASELVKRASLTRRMTTQVIETKNLTKKYGEFEAVKDLNLIVPPGSVSGFLGQNGSGKTTTLKMLMGAVRPSSGSGRVLDFAIDDLAQSVEIRKRVAFVSEDKQLYDYMTVEQIIRFTKSFFPKWRADLERQFLEEFPLPLDRRIKGLSKGMRTQLALFLGIARGPQMLVLDEPSEGLDPLGIETLLQMLKRLAAEGMNIFFSSHQIAEVEQIADHIFIIDRGELLISTTLSHLKSAYRLVRANLQGSGFETKLAIQGLKSIRPNGHGVSLLATHNLEQIVERLRNLGATDIQVLPVTLKEVFRQSLRAR